MLQKYLFLAVLFVTITLQLAPAQTQAINGSIRGRVIDPATSAIPNAAVSVTNDATGYAGGGFEQ